MIKKIVLCLPWLLFSCLGKTPEKALLVDPYFEEITNNIIPLRRAAGRLGLSFYVVNTDDQRRLNRLIQKYDKVYLSPLLASSVTDEQKTEGKFLKIISSGHYSLSDKHADYIKVDWAGLLLDLKELLAGCKKILFLYRAQAEQELYKDVFPGKAEIVAALLDSSLDYEKMFKRYAAQNFDAVILLNRGFEINLDPLIAKYKLDQGFYVVNNLSLTANDYFLVSEDYLKMIEFLVTTDEEKLPVNLFYMRKNDPA